MTENIRLNHQRYCWEDTPMPDTWIEGYWYMRGQMSAYNDMLKKLANNTLNMKIIKQNYDKVTEISKECLQKENKENERT